MRTPREEIRSRSDGEDWQLQQQWPALSYMLPPFTSWYYCFWYTLVISHGVFCAAILGGDPRCSRRAKNLNFVESALFMYMS